MVDFIKKSDELFRKKKKTESHPKFLGKPEQVNLAKKKNKISPVIWVIVGLVFLLIIIGALSGGGEKTEPEGIQLQKESQRIFRYVDSPNGLRLRAQPSLSAEILEVLKDKTRVEVLRQQNDWSEVKVGEKQGWVASDYLITSHEKMAEELREKIDFRVTAEEIYSRYVKCQEEIQWDSEGRVTFSPDIIPKKYEGKIVAITGTVEKAEDIVEVHKNSIGRSAWVEIHGETLPPIIQDLIDEGKRYYICLADKQGHACVAWVYSSSPQLINNVDKNDRITVVGKCNLTGLACDMPDLMNSEVIERY